MEGKRLPNLFIAGVNKSGTTSLFNYLVAHPEICGSSQKETFFFTPVLWKKEPNPKEEFKRFFKNCKDQKYVMEATPRYYFGGDRVAREIERVCGKVKIIVLLREPISRLFSFYLFKKRTLDIPKKMSFEEFLTQCETSNEDQKLNSQNQILFAIEESQYIDQIDEWIKVFGKENIKILFQDHLLEKPQVTMSELASWLDIDSRHFNLLNFSKENTAKSFKNVGLQRIARKLFKTFEQFWTANPKLKRSLAALYYYINGSSKKEELKHETKEKLQSYFYSYNLKLAKKLNELGYSELPDWLSHR